MSAFSKGKSSNIETYTRLLGYLRGVLWAFGLSILGFVMFAASQPLLAKLMEMVIDALNEKDTDARWLLPAVAVGIFAFRGLGMFLGNYFNEYVGATVIRTLKAEVFRQLIVLPASFYDSNSQGQLLHRLNSGVNQIQVAVTNALKTLIREGLTIAALLAYVFYLNWQLSLIFLCVAPVLGGLVAYSTRRLKKIARRGEGASGQAMQVSKELISNYAIVRGFGAESYESRRYESALDAAFRAQLKIRKLAAILTPLSQLIVATAVAFIIFMLLSPGILESNSTGELIGYLTAVALLPKPMQQLSGVNVTIQRAMVGAELVFAILDTPAERDAGTYAVDAIEGNVKISHLEFKYPSSLEPVLKDVSLEVHAGEMVALVGRSGSGKSTLASLLYRLYDVPPGTILVDGVDVNEFKLANLRKHIAVVSQSVSLFDDTVRNNIAYGDVSVTDAQVEHAVKRAHAADFISNLPNGLNTVIGENGLRLSGGQRQRISLARAFLKNAPILILDEATSALDNESESIVTKAIEELSNSRTAIVIAHRLSTILKADRLIVMDAGRIVEQGTHEELLARGGYYSELYNTELVSRSE